MLHRRQIIHQLAKNQPLWTQEEAIAFESARETLGHMIAICSTLIDEEEALPIPDLQRIAELEKKQDQFLQERLALHVDSKAEIIRIRLEYASKIKRYLKENGPCPV